MRLDNCVLALPKWANVPEKARKYARVAIKVSDILAHTIFMVVNDPENPQALLNTKILDEYWPKFVFGIWT